MKITKRYKIRSYILAATLFVCPCFIPHAAAQERSYLIDLNTRIATDLGGLGGSQTIARALNDAGQVAGLAAISGGASRAFLTGPDGRGIFNLGLMHAFDINDSGQVVGYKTTNGFDQAFITGPNGTDHRLLDPHGSFSNNAAFGINTAGQVVGYFDLPGYAFITGPDGTGMRDLGLGRDSSANDINDAGQVVGSITTPEYAPHAFITGPNGAGMRDLGTLGGLDSYASAINDAGQVVGSSRFTGEEFQGSYHAFITGPDGAGMRDLGTLGGEYSYASDINDAGQVVGNSDTPGDGALHAFITGPNGEGMSDLNSLVDLPSGIILTNAVGINNVGQVVAVGVIPEPETYAMFLAGLGLIGFMLRPKPLLV
jgi:probable HAF family extracellular repeat protein